MVVLTLAAVDLHCRLGPLLCILYRDEHDKIELHMSPIFLVLHTWSCFFLTAVGTPVHFHLSHTSTSGSPQRRPFSERNFFACISSTVSSQATTRRASC